MAAKSLVVYLLLLLQVQESAGDGDYDCFIGESSGAVWYVRNNGDWVVPDLGAITSNEDNALNA